MHVRGAEGRETAGVTGIRLDAAFRRVNLITGTDGVRYVVDMYREMVEHPDFVPADLRAGIEFRRWHDKGRIWRVRSKDIPPGARAADRRPRLKTARPQKLVNLLNPIRSGGG